MHAGFGGKMGNAGKIRPHGLKTNWDEIEQRLRTRHLKQLKVIAVIAVICAAASIFLYIFMACKSYHDYTSVEQLERTDTAAAHFREFEGNILKYSNDGASYTDVQNQLIWNQTFEMQNPMISVSGSYVAFADREGKEVYVLDTSGLCGKINVNMPISKMEVASHGIVAVLMEEEGIGYIALYNIDGEVLAEGAIHAESGGVPLDIALSPDGQNLSTAILDISSGKVKTTLHFYNFGSAGQEAADHIVGTYSYENTVIPDVAYVGNDRLIAFADNAVYTFNGRDKPKEGAHLEISEEILGVCYDSDYFALVFSGGKDESARNIRVYNNSCRAMRDIRTENPFISIRFLNNHEICLRSEQRCEIYTLGGRKKFEYDFEKNIHEVLHISGLRNYMFILENETELARLKLFDSARDEK